MLGMVDRIFALSNLHNIDLEAATAVSVAKESGLLSRDRIVIDNLESLALRNLSFHYPNSPETIILSDISATVPGGTITAVLGACLGCWWFFSQS